MDTLQRCAVLMRKWESDEGATTKELEELKDLLNKVEQQVSNTIENRVEEESHSI